MANKRLFSMKAACNYLGVSRMTLLDSEAKGLIHPDRTPGGHRRYTLEMLEDFLQANRANFREREFISSMDGEYLLPRFLSKLNEQLASPEELIKEALRNLVILLQMELGTVYLLDEDSRLRLRASFGIPRWLLKDLSIIEKPEISAEVLRHKQPMVYSGEESELNLDMEISQGVCAPLVYQDKALGVVHIMSTHRYQFFPSEIDILATIAAYLASLIVNSQLLVQQQTLVNELSLLNRISLAMETRTELDPVLDTFLDETLAVMDAIGGAVFLRDPSTDRLYVRAAKGYPEAIKEFSIPIGEGITGWVFDHGKQRLSPTLAKDPLYSNRANISIDENMSNICLPLRSADETLGAFHISRKAEHPFTPDEVRFLTTVGNQAAVIIRRALIFDKTARQVKMEHALRDNYEMMVENLPVGMAVVNADFKVGFWNRAMERMTKVDRADAINRNPREVFPMMESGWERLERVLQTGQPVTVGPYEHMTPRGVEGNCEAHISPIIDHSDNLIGALLYIYEI